jgi:hypothetical protein
MVSSRLINFVFGFFPISFILGNFIINLNVLLFCCLGIFQLRSKILKTKLNFLLKIIFLLFIFIILSTSLNFIQTLILDEHKNINSINLIKSIFFFRFFLVLLIVYLLSEFEIINFKYFLFSAAISPFLISLDVMYQYFFGHNIIGMTSPYTTTGMLTHYNTSFFGDETITGGFIQNFSFFSIFFASYWLRKKNKFFKLLFLVLTISILAMGIIFSGNRMPLILFVFGLLLILAFSKELRKIILLSFVCISILVSFIAKNDSFYERILYTSLYHNVSDTLTVFFSYTKNYFISKNQNAIGIEKEDEESSFYNLESNLKYGVSEKVGINPQSRLILTAIDTWKYNKIFGNGIKSFRLDCLKLEGEKYIRGTRGIIEYKGEYNLADGFLVKKKNRLCSNHPHNYYFEILTEIGIIGIFLILIIASIFFGFIFKNYKSLKAHNLDSLFLMAATISLFIEVFPIKSTGSIFSTGNATYIIIVSSIILSYRKIFEKKILSKNIQF